MQVLDLQLQFSIPMGCDLDDWYECQWGTGTAQCNHHIVTHRYANVQRHPQIKALTGQKQAYSGMDALSQAARHKFDMPIWTKGLVSDTMSSATCICRQMTALSPGRRSLGLGHHSHESLPQSDATRSL